MREFTSRFGDAILGVASGFDRIVFQGMIRPLMYPEGAMGFFRRRRIAFKDAKDWVLAQTKSLVAAVEEYSQEQCGRGITYLPSSRTRKEEVARERQAETTATPMVDRYLVVRRGGEQHSARAGRGCSEADPSLDTLQASVPVPESPGLRFHEHPHSDLVSVPDPDRDEWP